MDASEIAVVVYQLAVDAAGKDVDPEELATASVPSSPLAEFGLLGCARHSAVHNLFGPVGQWSIPASSWVPAAERIACESMPPEMTRASNPFCSRQRVAV